MNSKVAFIAAAAFVIFALMFFERRGPVAGYVCLGVAAVWAVIGIAAIVRDKRRKREDGWP
ncbi:MAG: hypothetical protein IJG61_03860 [Lachnospiraceae bacterium]|nr:hypothetical protein [Lachnospiraceae bacterium]